MPTGSSTRLLLWLACASATRDCTHEHVLVDTTDGEWQLHNCSVLTLIADEGARALAGAIRAGAPFVSLDLRRNRITELGLCSSRMLLSASGLLLPKDYTPFRPFLLA